MGFGTIHVLGTSWGVLECNPHRERGPTVVVRCFPDHSSEILNLEGDRGPRNPRGSGGSVGHLGTPFLAGTSRWGLAGLRLGPVLIRDGAEVESNCRSPLGVRVCWRQGNTAALWRQNVARRKPSHLAVSPWHLYDE